MQSVQEFSVNHGATADACANRQIDEGVQSLRRAPFPFAERCAIDVRIKADGNIEGRAKCADNVCIRPAVLGSGENVSICGRSQVLGRADRNRQRPKRRVFQNPIQLVERMR